MRQKQLSRAERGGVLYGRWSNSKLIVTELGEMESTFSSSDSFSFRVDKVRTENLVGFWHTHSRFPFHSPTDLLSYRRLVRLLQKRLIFVIFVRRDLSFRALQLRPGKLLPSLLHEDYVRMPCNWRETIFL